MGKSVAYYAGLIIGLLFVFLLIFVVARMTKKVGGKFGCFGKKNNFDERQIVARGKAFKAAYLSLVLMIIVAGSISDISNINLFMCIGGLFLLIVISVMIFAIICIVEDAYMSLNENARGINIMFGIIAVVNMISGIMNVKEHGIIKDGKFTVESMNLWSGILFTVLIVVFNIKLIVSNRDSENE